MFDVVIRLMLCLKRDINSFNWWKKYFRFDTITEQFVQLP